MKQKKAIALRYPEGVEAPVIVAKGKGRTAETIISIAEKNNIQIAEDITLINLLENVETGVVVPEEAWEALAVIFAFILGE